MFDNISEFRSFYKTPLGRRVAAAMRDQIRAFWQGAPSMTRVFLGYGQPFTDRDLAALGLMPARRGAAVWPTIWARTILSGKPNFPPRARCAS